MAVEQFPPAVRLSATLFVVSEHEFSGRDLILLAGGVFSIWKSTHEIHERLEIESEFADGQYSTNGSAAANAGRSASSGFVLVRIDKTLPGITITSPNNPTYLNTVQLPIDWTASDGGSGIAFQSATVDSSPVAKGQVIDLLFRPLGAHTVAVNITDNAGNQAAALASFSIIATADSVSASIDRFLAMGAISNAGVANSLQAKLGKNPTS